MTSREDLNRYMQYIDSRYNSTSDLVCPVGELFLPRATVCDHEYCIYGTNVAHNCPCRKCDGTGYLS